jgi:hypothetical protein
VLLGKILRIDVSTPGAYSSPSTNPFAGATAGRDEIYAYGLRNPWRFSVDRLTGQVWVGDVGQGAREEVDTPIVKGGNYGWRVFEGTSCTGNGPTACNAANYVFPILEYAHAGGRCSITGGHVYRGSQNTVPSGTYLYGDYCTGEIFAWNGSAQSLLLDTSMNISSFGEDQNGEIYVVGYATGTIHRLTRASSTACTYAITPTLRGHAYGGGSGTVAVTAGTGCGWTATANNSWLHITGGASGTGKGTVTYSVDANSSASDRAGTLTIAGRKFTISQGWAPCSPSISPTSVTVGRAAATRTVSLTIRSSCTWTATSTASWLKVIGGASGTGNGVVTYTIAKYTGATSRTGTLTIATKKLKVTQKR